MLETGDRGAVLQQEKEDGKMHPMVHTSRSLSKTEKENGAREMEPIRCGEEGQTY